jgi:hypothetical protein
MRVVAVVLTALILGGCGKIGVATAKITGYSRTCIEGVSYLQFPSGVTVEYTVDGKVKTCR